jgi:hypothetical protein
MPAVLEKRRRSEAAGILAITDKLEVHPLDDAELLEGAKPVKGRKTVFDKKANAARNDAQVKAAMESGPVSVIILGGDHDLNHIGERALGYTHQR